MNSTTSNKSASRQRQINSRAGQRMRLMRKILGVNQKELGDELGLSQQQVHNYEEGRLDIRLSRLQEICDVLQTDPATFLSGSTNEEETKAKLADKKALRCAAMAKKLEALPIDTVIKLEKLVTILEEQVEDKD